MSLISATVLAFNVAKQNSAFLLFIKPAEYWRALEFEVFANCFNLSSSLVCSSAFVLSCHPTSCQTCFHIFTLPAIQVCDTFRVFTLWCIRTKLNFNQYVYMMGEKVDLLC